MTQPLLLIDLSKAWSKSARDAALAARKAGQGVVQEQKTEQGSEHGDNNYESFATPRAPSGAVLHAGGKHNLFSVGSENASAETKQKLIEAAATGDYGKSHAVRHEAAKQDTGFAHDMQEAFLSGARGIKITGRGVNKDGLPFTDFTDSLYDAHGTMTLMPKIKRGHSMEVELKTTDGHSVKAKSLGDTRIQMKRIYYGGDPKKTLKQQGMGVGDPRYQVGFAVGRKARRVE